MYDKQLNDLEAKINELEERIEADIDFVIGDEFHTLYYELFDFYTMIKDFKINALPYGELSEEREELLLKPLKRFKKLESRINIIKADADIEDGSTDWMFDKDGDEKDNYI